jgi:hypothetical protein
LKSSLIQSSRVKTGIFRGEDMGSDSSFQQILSDLLLKNEKSSNEALAQAQINRKIEIKSPSENWWHSVPEMNQKRVFTSSSHVHRFTNPAVFKKQELWKPIGLPPEITQAFLFFHEFGATGLTDKSSPMHLKKAYRRLAKALHPDLRQESDTAPFRELQKHYSTLERFISAQAFGT